MRYNELVQEGIKFGQKEINDILSRSGDFNVGIEYEFRLPPETTSKLKQLLDEYNLYSSVSMIEAEHDNMTEVVTKKLTVTDAVSNIKQFFKMFSDNDIEVPKMAGMHISISTNKYDLSKINMAKFLVLMNGEHLHRLFPERKYVVDITKKVILLNSGRISDKSLGTTFGFKRMESVIEETLDSKYQTIKVSDYSKVDMNGRIELRFFGGKDYHKQFSKIKQEMIRSLFLLEIAYTDLFDKEYKKQMYKLMNSTRTHNIKKVTEDPTYIKEIKNPSEELKTIAVRLDGETIQYIENPSEELQLMAVGNLSSVIRFIKNPYESAQEVALSNSGILIKYIKNPSEKMKKVAVENTGSAIFHIENPSEELMIIAVSNSRTIFNTMVQHGMDITEKVKRVAVETFPQNILYIENPSEELMIIAVTKGTFVLEQLIEYDIEVTEKVKQEAIKYFPSNIAAIENPSEELKRLALTQNPLTIQSIENPTISDIELALKQDPETLKVIREVHEDIDIPEETLLNVVEEEPNMIAFIDNPSEAVQLQAVRRRGLSIQFLNNPSEEVQIEAIKETFMAIAKINNPTEKAKEKAVRESRYALSLIRDFVEGGASNKLITLHKKLWEK